MIKGTASELIKWLVGFWMDAMAWRAGWTHSVIYTQQRLLFFRDLDKIVSEADILVVGIGSPNFVKVN